MEDRNEIFGRKINFEDIQDIKKVFQPGILSLPYFFNPNALKDALEELCGFSPRDIMVYFNGVTNGIASDSSDKKRKWWEVFQAFASKVSGHFPAGCELEYWYGPDGKEFSLPEFKEDQKPFQAFVRLFDNAVHGFSCFVNDNPNILGFSSERNNYHTIKPGEGFVHDKHSLWKGKSDVFLESAVILHNAFYDMERGYIVCRESRGMRNLNRSDVRIICDRGALVGSLYGSDSVTLLLKNDSIDNIVKQHTQHMDNLVALRG